MFLYLFSSSTRSMHAISSFPTRKATQSASPSSSTAAHPLPTRTVQCTHLLSTPIYFPLDSDRQQISTSLTCFATHCAAAPLASALRLAGRCCAHRNGPTVRSSLTVIHRALRAHAYAHGAQRVSPEIPQIANMCATTTTLDARAYRISASVCKQQQQCVFRCPRHDDDDDGPRAQNLPCVCVSIIDQTASGWNRHRQQQHLVPC